MTLKRLTKNRLQLNNNMVTLWNSVTNYLLNDGVTHKSVEPTVALKYQGNFYGLIISLGIPPEYAYPIMKVNDLASSTDYNGKLLNIVIPAEDNLYRLYSLFKKRIKDGNG